MYHFRFVMRYLLFAKTLVEVEQVASCAVVHKLWGRHIRQNALWSKLACFLCCGYSLQLCSRIWPCVLIGRRTDSGVDIRGAHATMAIIASELHACVIRPNQIGLQMEIVIQLDAAWIART